MGDHHPQPVFEGPPQQQGIAEILLITTMHRFFLAGVADQR
jgi:hypothetical protein